MSRPSTLILSLACVCLIGATAGLAAGAAPSKPLVSWGVPVLLMATGHDDQRIRLAATKVLWELAARDEVVADTLIRRLHDDEPRDRELAARFIRDMAPRSPGAREAIRSELRSATGWLRVALAESLWKLGDDRDGALKALRPALDEGDAQTRGAAEAVLRDILSGPAGARPGR